MVLPKGGKRLLVTGASGFLGWNVCRIARERWKVTGVVHRNCLEVADVVATGCDLAGPSAVKELFRRIRPDAVIHAAAVTDPNYCQAHEHEAAAINTAAPMAIARQCALLDIPCVFTSTDLVFDGARPPYREEDPVCPLNVYGRQKADAERGMLDVNARATVCRMPLMYGDAPPHAKSFIQPMIDALRSGRELTLFIDEYRTPVSATDAAAGLVLAVEKAPSGILHLGGPQRLSRYEMGSLLAGACKITPNIRACLRKDMVMAAPRAADVSLDSGRAHSLGFFPGRMREELAKLTCVKHR